MASIGSVTCDFLKAELEPPPITIEVAFSRRPGTDGLVAEALGNRGGPFVLRATKFDSSANISSWLADLRALAGAAAVTVTLDSTLAYTSCYVGRTDGPAVEIVEFVATVESNVAKFKCVARVYGERSAT